MKKIIYTLVLLLAPALGPVTYAQGKTSNEQNMKENQKTLVAFFSRTGENYAVGNIEKGNTHIVAEMIAGKTGADIFQIETVNPYPEEYNACVEIAKTEKENNARPEVKDDVKVEDYDVIFLGYPNWWGDMPMAVYTFIEKHDWQGKTMIPFCTHEGSGLGSTGSKIEQACKGSIVLKGLAMRGKTAQNSQEEAQKAVDSWLKSLKL